MISMVFSNKTTPKTHRKTVQSVVLNNMISEGQLHIFQYSSTGPLGRYAYIAPIDSGMLQSNRNDSNIVNTQNIETVYAMQNSMIGRLMNSKKCGGCPKH